MCVAAREITIKVGLPNLHMPTLSTQTLALSCNVHVFYGLLSAEPQLTNETSSGVPTRTRYQADTKSRNASFPLPPPVVRLSIWMRAIQISANYDLHICAQEPWTNAVCSLNVSPASLFLEPTLDMARTGFAVKTKEWWCYALPETADWASIRLQ